MTTISTIYLAQVQREPGFKRQWVVFDKTHVLRARIGEGRASVLGRWAKDFGPIASLVTYKGTFSPAELAMTISDIQHPREEQSA